jgi:hypothetical protein
MSQGHKSLRSFLTEALIASGTWMNRSELQGVRECSDIALEDALADLVVDRVADYRENVGYRLSGTGVCRRAAQLMQREGKRAAVVSVPGKEGVRVGVAEHRAAVGLVMYELALPLPGPDEDALQVCQDQTAALLAFANSRGGSECL